jgi:hypothetical protein
MQCVLIQFCEATHLFVCSNLKLQLIIPEAFFHRPQQAQKVRVLNLEMFGKLEGMLKDLTKEEMVNYRAEHEGEIHEQGPSEKHDVAAEPPKARPTEPGRPDDLQRRVAALERELSATKEELSAKTEELTMEKAIIERLTSTRTIFFDFFAINFNVVPLLQAFCEISKTSKGKCWIVW